MNTTKESYANWIDVGEGFELVSWTTQITFAAQFTHDGKTWIDMFGQDQTPAYWICCRNEDCGENFGSWNSAPLKEIILNKYDKTIHR